MTSPNPRGYEKVYTVDDPEFVLTTEDHDDEYDGLIEPCSVCGALSCVRHMDERS